FPTAEYDAAMTAYHAAMALAEPSKAAFHASQAIKYAVDASDKAKNPIPVKILRKTKGKELAGIKYEPLFGELEAVKEYCERHPNSFRVIIGDFVSTEDGTGIVHISPTFGADDKRVADYEGIKGLLVKVWVLKDGSSALAKEGVILDFNNPVIVEY